MEMKTCACCGEEFPATLEFFYKDKTGKFGLRARCKRCMNEQDKQWRENNKEHLKQYYQDNKEHRADYMKQWCENNKEYRSEYLKQWREDNKEHVKQYREDTKEHKAEYGKQWKKDNKEKVYAYNAKRRAIKKGAKEGENFTRQDVLDEWGTDCHICGEPIDLDEWHQDHVLPLQPEEGEPGPHTLDNVKPSHPHCNLSKGNKIYETIQQ